MRFLPAQRKARRTLLVAAAILLMSPIPGSILVDLCPIAIRDPDAANAIARWRAHPAAPEILILGSSHSGYCIDTTATTSLLRESPGESDVRIFNASLTAGDPIMTKFLADRLLAQTDAPRLVMIEVNAELCARRNPHLDFAITRFFTARDIFAHLGDLVHSTTKTWSRLLSSRLIPFYGHRGNFRAWAAQEWNSSDDFPRATVPPAWEAIGWDVLMRHDLSGDVPAKRFPRRLRLLQWRLTDYEVAGATPAALEHVVALCRQRGAAVVIFQPPLHSAHRAFYSPVVTDRFRTFVDGLVQVYDCRFVDLSARLPDAMFADNEHVNFDGRRVATRMIAQEILAPAWRELRAAPPK